MLLSKTLLHDLPQAPWGFTLWLVWQGLFLTLCQFQGCSNPFRCFSPSFWGIYIYIHTYAMISTLLKMLGGPSAHLLTISLCTSVSSLVLCPVAVLPLWVPALLPSPGWLHLSIGSLSRSGHLDIVSGGK